MRKPRPGRAVKSTESALARTNRPLGDAEATTRAFAEIVGARDENMAHDGFENVVTGIGTVKDKRSFSTFTVARPLTQLECENMYRSSWPAAKFVDTLPQHATKNWIDYTWDGHDDEGDASKAREIRDADTDLDLCGSVLSADSWGRLYGGGAIVVSIKGDLDWSKPLDWKRIRKGSIEMFHVLDRYRCFPTGNIDRTRGPNFGKPIFYGIAEAEAQVSLIHWTRVVIFDGKRVPYFAWQNNGRWHDSVLQNTQDNIRDYEDARANANALVPESNVDILSIPNLTDILGAPGGEAKIMKRVALGAQLKSAANVWILDGGSPSLPVKGAEAWQQKVSQFSGVNSVLEASKDDLCGAFDMPMTVLFGRSPGGMNSTGDSDTNNWHAKVERYQGAHLTRPVTRLAIMLAMHTFGSLPKNFEIKWRPLSNPTDAEQSTTDLARAQRDKIYLDAGVVTPQGMTQELLERRTYRTLEQKDVKLAEEMAREATEAEQAAAKAANARLAAPKPGAPAKATAAG